MQALFWGTRKGLLAKLHCHQDYRKGQGNRIDFEWRALQLERDFYGSIVSHQNGGKDAERIKAEQKNMKKEGNSVKSDCLEHTKAGFKRQGGASPPVPMKSKEARK